MAIFLKSLSLKFRLVALFVLVFGLGTLIFTFASYYYLNESLLQDFDNALYNYSIDVANTIESSVNNDSIPLTSLVDQNKIFPFSSGDAFIVVRYFDGEILSKSNNFSNLNFPFKNALNEILRGADSSYTTISTAHLKYAEADSYRLITFPIDNSHAPRFYLQIAVPMTTFEMQYKRLLKMIFIGLPIILIVAIFFGYYLSSRALLPIQNLIEATKKLNAQNLSNRVPLPQPQDEIKILTETQNQMLDRIEKAFKSQERFVADASHQLLTPLTILKGEIETKLHKKPEDTAFLSSLLEEVDHLSAIVKDMLLLARIDSGAAILEFQNMEIEDIIVDVINNLKKKALTTSVQIHFDVKYLVEQKKEVLGNIDLTYNLFYNIVDNAIKYSPPSQSVGIFIVYQDSGVVVDILDNGEGISAEIEDQLFSRFNQANTSSKNKGYGLGLSIAKKIADLQQFKISTISKDQHEWEYTGACFRVYLPAKA